MFNKRFKREWNLYNGEINIIECNHFTLGFDKDYFGFAIEISMRYKMAYFKLFNLNISVF